MSASSAHAYCNLKQQTPWFENDNTFTQQKRGHFGAGYVCIRNVLHAPREEFKTKDGRYVEVRLVCRLQPKATLDGDAIGIMNVNDITKITINDMRQIDIANCY